MKQINKNAEDQYSQDEDDDIPLFHDCDREILGNVKALSNRDIIFTL